MMKTEITREEALRRLKATKAVKEQLIAVLRQRMCEKYREKTGIEPKHVLFL